MSMLLIEELYSGYGEIEVLHGVSLNVQKGEIVTIIGANGAGKTTLLNTISGLVKTRAGHIKFEGKPIHHLPPHSIVALGITQAPEGRALLTRQTILENLQMGAYLRRDRNIADDIERMYEKFPALKERASHPAGVLSGGQQQMLAIARALMARPKLLLFDEPSLGLAPKIVSEIFETIRGLRDNDLTILLIEQNAKKALQVSDRGYVIERGRITLEGKGSDLMNDDQVQRNYLGRQQKEKIQQPAQAGI